MSWRTVVRDDLLDVRRSRLGMGVAGIVLSLTVGVGVLVALSELTRAEELPPYEFGTVMLTVGGLLAFLLPFVAMLGSYGAIILERERGSVRFLLGFPNSRFDAYLGKYLSRAVLLGGSLLVGFAVFGGIAAAILGDPSLVDYLLFVPLTLVFGLVFVGFGLAASAVLDSETSVTSAVIATYVVFRGGWMAVQWVGLRLTRPPGELSVRPLPDWYYFVGRANPMNAYAKLFDSLFNDGPLIALLTTPRPEVNTVATSDLYATVALLGWLVVVPVLGYLVFSNKDVL